MRSWLRLQGKLGQRRRRPGFESPFGGLWLDRLDGAERLRAKVARGELQGAEGAALEHFREQGFWIAPAALAREAALALARELDALWNGGPGQALAEVAGSVQPFSQELRARHCKLIDLHAAFPAVREAALDAPLRDFLRLLFEEPPLLFQSLAFERGSEQPAHQDTAYVPVVPPLEFAAAWIALEDVQPGSGELFYYPRSHRIPSFRFRGGCRNWNRERDGLEGQVRYHAWLDEQMQRNGLERRTFLPRLGDVLFWHADLVHGGVPIRDPAISRKSLVCHYCPRQARPYYAFYQRDRRVQAHASGAAWMHAAQGPRPA